MSDCLDLNSSAMQMKPVNMLKALHAQQALCQQWVSGISSGGWRPW